MKVHEIATHGQLVPQKLSVRETPHLVLEPNTTCNIRCAACYNVDKGHVKPLEQVIAEIDRGLALRDLDTISILGGEPTLHPDIERIVEAIKSRGLFCIMLTNGVGFLEDPTRIDRLMAAGVDRFVLHVDHGQEHVHADIDAARRALAELMEQRRMWFALSVTMRRGQEDGLPALMKDYAAFRFFDGILVTLAMDPAGVVADQPPADVEPDFVEVYRSMGRHLGVEPTAYIPSSLADDDVSWLMYFYYLNSRTGAAFATSPRVSRLFRWLYRRLTGRHFFGATLQPRWFLLGLWVSILVELLIRPTRLGEVSRLLRDARGALRLHYVVLQESPRFDHAAGRLRICWHCPDATIRNGLLTPVCIADQINPLGVGPRGARASPEVVHTVLAHLEQDPAAAVTTG